MENLQMQEYDNYNIESIVKKRIINAIRERNKELSKNITEAVADNKLLLKCNFFIHQIVI